MATFYCSECNFSKPVKDEMAGKKARCPKCNAVNVVPELGEEPSIEPADDYQPESAPAESSPPAAAEPAASSPPAAEPVASSPPAAEPVVPTPVATSEPAATIASAPSQTNGEASVSGFPMLSRGWLMAFGGALLPIIAGILLLSLKSVGLAMICFAIGMLAFGGLAAYYSFT